MEKPPNLELNIDRLVLHGVSPRHRRRVAEAMEKELRRLFAGEGGAGFPRMGTDEGLPRPGGGIDLDARAFPMPAGLAPEQIGARVAGAVWASYRRAAGAPSGGASPPGPAAPRDLGRSTLDHDVPGGDSR